MTAARMLVRFIWKPATAVKSAARLVCPTALSRTLGGIVGFMAMIGEHVDQLYVDPSHQRSGIGSALLGEALKAAPGRTTLDVFEQNTPARAFYEKHGFEARDRWMNEEEGAIDLRYVRG